MDEWSQGTVTAVVALVAGIIIFLASRLEPVEKLLRKIDPGPEKGLRALGLAALALYIFVAVAMSIAIMLRLLGAAGE